MAGFNYYQVTNAGGTVTLTSPYIPDSMYVFSDSGVVLAANYSLEYDTLPPVGTKFNVLYGFPSIDVNGNTISIFGVTLTTEQIALTGSIDFTVIDDGGGASLASVFVPADLVQGTGAIYGSWIVDNTVTVAKLTGLSSAQIIVGDGSTPALPVARTVTGDVTISNTGVTAIAAGVIVDADINASAAITRSKIAAGTASQVVINAAGTGLLSSEAQLANSRGGTGQDTSASNGFPNVAAGTWSVGALTDITRRENISFVTAQQGTYYIYFPFPCTVTQANVRVTSVVSGTDDGELLFENDASAAMTGDNLTAGVLTVAASAAFGTGYTTSLDTNNTFTAGQEMRITSSKPTTGGIVSVDITYTRLTLS